MTSKELITFIKALDPELTCDIVINNIPIISVDKHDADYNGWYQKYKYESSNIITRAEYIGIGRKLVIYTYPLAEALDDYPDLPVDFTGIDINGTYKDLVYTWRAKSKDKNDENKISKELCSSSIGDINS